MASSYDKGGTGMIQFDLFAKALKITWIRRLCKYNCNSKIYHLYKASTPECNFDYSAKEYWNMIADQCSNSFWKNVFTYWRDYTSLLVPTNREQVLCSSIWNNINIKVGSKSVLYKAWDKGGIRYVNDLMSPDGEFLSLHDIQRKYYDVKINFLLYYGIKKSISKSFSHLLSDSSTCITLQNPFQGIFLRTIVKDIKGCKQQYNTFINALKVNFKCIEKWNNLLNINVTESDWKIVCNFNWKCTQEVKLRWFQFRLLNRILCTNLLLVKIGKSDNPKCTFCNKVNESIVHLFWECEFIVKYWYDFQNWINNNLNTNISLKKETILFGKYIDKDYIFNNLLLILKFNIYRSRVKKEKPSFISGKKELYTYQYYQQEHFMYNANMKKNAFENRWHIIWKFVLEFFFF